MGAEPIYQRLLETFNLKVAQSSIEYRLSMALQESLSTNAFQSYLPSTLPVIASGQGPGFAPVLDCFLGPEHKAKISLLLCAHAAEVELSHLALLKELQARGARVLELDCAAYAGKSSKGSVRARLQALKLQPDAALLSEPLVLLLKGYQNLGAYDNLYVQNQLGTWPQLKVLVSCTAAFFASRSPLNCFLKLGSERRIEDLVVYTVPGFAPQDAKKLSLSTTQAMPVAKPAPKASVIAAELPLEPLSPQRQAEQLELMALCKDLQGLWIEQGVLKSNSAQNPQVFISYAWEPIDNGARARQQRHLSSLADNLRALGFRPWLDIEQMTGDIDAQMKGNIAQSDYVLLIGTPLYKARSVALEKDGTATNVRKEYEEIVHQQQSRGLKVLPLHCLGDSAEQALPALFQQSPAFDARGMDEDYVGCMSAPAQGFIPRLLALLQSDKVESLYQGPYQRFQAALKLLVAKHLMLGCNQSLAESLDVGARLEAYIEPFALASEIAPLNTRFDLRERLEGFLKSKDKTLVVLARAGSGKSLFALDVFKRYLAPWQAYKAQAQVRPAWLPVYISLKHYSQASGSLIKTALIEQYQLSENELEALKQGFGYEQGLLVIADGFDELGAGEEGYPNLSAQLADWPHARLIVTSRPEYFDSAHPVSQVLRPSQGFLSSVFVSPFSPTEIERYIAHYERHQSTDTYKTLQALPGMMELLNNPFLLNLVLQSLPQLLKNTQGLPKILRLHVYEAFAQTWFSQETQGRGQYLQASACHDFARGLAFELFRAGVLSPQSDYPALWDFFEKKAHAAAREATPLRLSSGLYSFVHKSVYEYFLAEHLYQALMTEKAALWNESSLVPEGPVIQFLLERRQTLSSEAQGGLDAKLFALMEASKKASLQGKAASNAITVLNAAGVPFSGLDFSHICIPGANLQSALCDGTNFEGADLSRVNFNSAWLSRASLKHANLQDVDFEEWPAKKHASEVRASAYSRDGSLLAVGEKNGLITIYNARTLEKLREHSGHSSWVTTLAYSPDGLELCSGSSDNTLKVWDARGGTLEALRSYRGGTATLSGPLPTVPMARNSVQGLAALVLIIPLRSGMPEAALQMPCASTRGTAAVSSPLPTVPMARNFVPALWIIPLRSGMPEAAP